MPAWFKATKCVDAPYNDFNVWKDVKSYHDKGISESALKVIERHLWYLAEETAVLCLFSDKVSSEEKNTMAKTLLKYSRNQTLRTGIPQFPIVTEHTRPNKFVGQNSWLLFNLLGHKGDWLKTPPVEWNKSEEYQEALNFLQNLKVVNDTAERGIKLISDYATSITNDEEEKQFLLQIVENHRKQVPNITKSNLEKM